MNATGAVVAHQRPAPAGVQLVERILTNDQIRVLRAALGGRLLAVCFGAGVDSTAMLIALRAAGLRPHLVTFADTGGEKPETLEHVHAMNHVLSSWGWPSIDVCRKATRAETSYSDLFGNCMANETLPSLAFGMKSCSIKWKQDPQDQFLRGAKTGPNARAPHPLWLQAKATGQRIVKLIGYDCGVADRRRSRNLKPGDAHFDYQYPLQLIGWARADCVQAIAQTLGHAMVPIKSACFFCPASKAWELFWLAAHHPDLLDKALVLERNALTGRHSRFDEVEFGASWEDLVRNADRFPSSSTSVGLGRSFAWNQWARVNDVVDSRFKVRRAAVDQARFAAMADQLQAENDNALDVRRARRILAITIDGEQDHKEIQQLTDLCRAGGEHEETHA
ncbi:hypothetical protein [Pseudomonas aeruginosa]|uniref:hypothetical protein n=2 Tax=Pseudomonas aeruginosa TaxID=287 RepID=UPI000ABD3FC9|nr:hypothetical protein [Pseudomonas aeruginosa]MBO8292153.1 hypothetical protein [Pseudomonas aeruginosa]